MNEIARTGPSMNRAGSKQDYGTPWELIRAIEKRFGPLVHDLAASPENAKAPSFYSEHSKAHDWAAEFPTGNLWLNPPFRDINNWARKCRYESKQRQGFIIMLTPASVGSLWFFEHVRKHAYVLPLAPRITFEGAEDPYPKDCMLSVFGHGFRGFEPWWWKREPSELCSTERTAK